MYNINYYVNHVPVAHLVKGAGSSLEHAHSGRENWSFLWATGNSTFRCCIHKLYCRDSVIQLNSCCFFCHRDNNRSRLEKLPCLDYSLKKFCIFFDRCAEKWLPERQKCKDLSAHRCLPMSMPYFFVLAWASGTFLSGCWAWDCHKFLQKTACCYKRAIVESIVKQAIFTQARTNVTRLRVRWLITRQR